MPGINSKDMFGKGMIAAFVSIFIFIAGIILTNKFDVFSLDFGLTVRILVASILAVCSMLIYYYALNHLPLSKLNKVLVMSGPYKYVRHPRYAAIIFFISPAFAFILNSWLCLISTIVIYLVFRYCIRKEEKNLVNLFGEDYETYIQKTPRILPKALIKEISFFY